jgi:hypothetical protein
MRLTQRRKASPFARTRVNAKAALRLAVRRFHTPADRPVAKDLVVSFTAIPPRIPTVHMVVDSLLLQSVVPERIVLYLSKADFPDRSVLRKVEARVGDCFEIRWLDTNLGSYRKLVHALEAFPDKAIITVDDDKIYAAGAIESMLATARRHPRHVVFRQGFTIRPDFRLQVADREPGLWHIPVGVGGILYPPGSLVSDVTDSSLFLALAPHADDIWFRAMALLAGTPAVLAQPKGGEDHSLWFRWSESLSYHNTTLHKWETQLAATFGHYGIVPGVDPGRLPPTAASAER